MLGASIMALSTVLAIIALFGAVLSGFITIPLWPAVFLIAAAFIIAQRGQ